MNYLALVAVVAAGLTVLLWRLLATVLAGAGAMERSFRTHDPAAQPSRSPSQGD